MGLNIKDLKIIFALEEDPTITITDLAKKLNISRPTIKTHLEKLKDAGMLRKPIALIKPEKMGLERKHIFVSVPNLESLEILEKSGDEHPYTRYRARTFGGTFGLYMQFEIPPKTDNLLREFFQILKEKKFVNDFKTFSSTGVRIESYPDINKFNQDNLSWDFSWESWFNNLKNYSYTIKQSKEEPLEKSEYKPIHLNILSELSYEGGKHTQTELKDKFRLSKTEAHRQYSKVIEQYVDRFRLLYDRKSFNLTETCLAIANLVDSKTQGRIFNQIKENPPPFHFRLELLENANVIMWGSMSTLQADQFAFSAWKKLKNLEMYILSTQFGRARLYYFHPDNFDFDSQDWIKTHKYIVDEPIQRLKI